MLDEKKLKETQSRIKQYLTEGVIKTKQEKEFVSFFMKNAEKSLATATVLYDLSTKRESQEKLNLVDFDGFLWVVNASYYSMFYIARALLENEGIKINTDLSVHAVTFDAVITFFYLNGTLQKRLIEDFAESMEEATELLGQQKAESLVQDYFYEKRKRAQLTYSTEEVVIKAKAKTSLDRAEMFMKEIRKIIR